MSLEDQSSCARPCRSVPAAVVPVVLLIVFAAAYATLLEWPAWPVGDASARITYSAIAASACGIAASFIKPCWARLPVNAGAIAACVLPSMWPMMRPTDWSTSEFALWAAVVIVPISLIVTSAQRLANADRSMLMPLVLLGMSFAAGGLLLSTGSFTLGQAGFFVGGGMLIVTIAAIFSDAIRTSAGAITFVVAVLAGLLVSGRLWSELPIVYGVTVFLAPVLAWLVRVKWIAAWPRWRRVLTVLLLAAVPAIAATAVAALKAYQALQESASESSSSYY